MEIGGPSRSIERSAFLNFSWSFFYRRNGMPSPLLTSVRVVRRFWGFRRQCYFVLLRTDALILHLKLIKIISKMIASLSEELLLLVNILEDLPFFA
jgi:hypothetical protein